MTDAALIPKILAGDQKASHMLVDRYQNLVISVALNETGDFSASEDLAQRAFLIAWEKRFEIPDSTKVGSWLCGIVKNLAKNYRRKAERKTQNLDSAESVSDEIESADRLAMEKEQQELLWSSIENIPETYRLPLILFYREGQSIKAVADAMELSTDVVKKRLSRGREMLRDEMLQFVEDSLFQTRPTKSFSLAVVMAASGGISKIGAGTATQGVFLSKILGVFTMSGAILGSILGSLGGMLGIGGAVFGVKMAERSATSQKEVTFLWRCFWVTLVLTLLHTSAILCVAFVPALAAHRFTLNIILWSLFAAGIVFGNIFLTIRYQKIRREADANAAQKK